MRSAEAPAAGCEAHHASFGRGDEAWKLSEEGGRSNVLSARRGATRPHCRLSWHCPCAAILAPAHNGDLTCPSIHLCPSALSSTVSRTKSRNHSTKCVFPRQ